MATLGPIPWWGSALSFVQRWEQALQAAPRLWRLCVFALLIGVLALDLPARSGDWLRSGTDMDQVLPSLRVADADDAWRWITGPWIGKVIVRGSDPFVYYRPVTSLLWLAQFQLFGENVRAWQSVSIGLHLLSVLLVVGICRQMGRGAALPALIGATAWACRERNRTTLEWTPAQTDHFAAFFGLLALWLMGTGLERSGWRRWLCLLASAPVAVLAMGAKEIALTVPVLGAIMALFAPRAPLRLRIGVAIGALALLGTFFAWRTQALGGLGFLPGQGMPAPTLWERAIKIGEYLLPLPLSSQALVPPGVAVGVWLTIRGLRSFYDMRSRIVVAGAGLGGATWLLGDPLLWFLPNESGAMLSALTALVLTGQLLRQPARDTLRLLAWGAVVHAPLYHVVFNSAGYVSYLPDTYWALVWTALAVRALRR